MMTWDQFWEYAEFITSCLCTYAAIAMLAFPLLIGGKLCH